MPTYNRLPLAIESAEGNTLIDADGNSYMDLFTGLAVNVLGHSHPRIMQALEEQGKSFLHISNYFVAPPAVTLAKRLVEHSIPGKVFFANSGAEATEAAVKLVHKWAKAETEAKKGIVVLKNSFHGRTLGTIQLTRQEGVYQDFPAADFPVYESEAEDIEQLRRTLAEHKPAAVLMEPVLGSGGIVPLSEEYISVAAQLCNEYGTLFIMDEIQTGNGRTGTLFAYQHCDVSPDIVLFAKGVGGGLPLGGLIAGDKVLASFQPGDHGTTFGPSPLSAALGNAVLDALFKDDELTKGAERARYLWQKLMELTEEFPQHISGVRGKGMMLGVVMNMEGGQVKKLRQELMEAGYLVDITQQSILRLLPPLTLTFEEIDDFISSMRKLLPKSREGAET
ncbi:aspartate aminotransferase family protein [Salsuginibacillus kocurii]|uniref:aspartate aminotransferase family protein n=1 Tax=Salsuginibacillus kocurii TaxID=427078 RepID=UPI00059034C3|nr:acetylornithine transaminase [Salsuginibacillus kocurii]